MEEFEGQLLIPENYAMQFQEQLRKPQISDNRSLLALIYLCETHSNACETMTTAIAKSLKTDSSNPPWSQQ